MGSTALGWAALNGHEEVVKILLGQDDIDPNKPDDEDRIPLWWASHNGHGEITTRTGRRNDGMSKMISLYSILYSYALSSYFREMTSERSF